MAECEILMVISRHDPSPAPRRGGAALTSFIAHCAARGGAGWGGLVGGERGFKPIFRGMGKLWRMVSTAQAAAVDN